MMRREAHGARFRKPQGLGRWICHVISTTTRQHCPPVLLFPPLLPSALLSPENRCLPRERSPPDTTQNRLKHANPRIRLVIRACAIRHDEQIGEQGQPCAPTGMTTSRFCVCFCILGEQLVDTQHLRERFEFLPEHRHTEVQHVAQCQLVDFACACGQARARVASGQRGRSIAKSSFLSNLPAIWSLQACSTAPAAHRMR